MADQRCRTANCPKRQEGTLCEDHGGPKAIEPAPAAAGGGGLGKGTKAASVHAGEVVEPPTAPPKTDA